MVDSGCTVLLKAWIKKRAEELEKGETKLSGRKPLSSCRECTEGRKGKCDLPYIRDKLHEKDKYFDEDRGKIRNESVAAGSRSEPIIVRESGESEASRAKMIEAVTRNTEAVARHTEALTKIAEAVAKNTEVVQKLVGSQSGFRAALEEEEEEENEEEDEDDDEGIRIFFL